MKRSVKIAVLTAAALVVLGLMVSGLGFGGMGFNFRALNTEDIISNTYEITEDFRHISVETDTADLYFLPAQDGVCRVECTDFANEVYRVGVENDTLYITTIHEHHIRLFSIGENSVRLYLPAEEYQSLEIHQDTGDIHMPEGFSFGQGTVSTTTGDVVWSAPVSGDLSITVDTGDIKMKHAVVDGKLTVRTDTGDVVFDRSDAAELFVQTDTGDVSGTLLSDKIFFARTDTGDVDVPKSVTGGLCEIITDTGDIELGISG